MVGIDIVEVNRFSKHKAEDFLGRVLNQSEVDYINSRPNKFQTTAGLFAAKEAAAKALGTGFDGAVKFCDITILHDQNGRPFVNLTGGAAERLNELGKEIHISISHTDNNAAAVAIIK